MTVFVLPAGPAVCHKIDPDAVAFTLPTSSTVSLKAGITIAVGSSRMVHFDSDTPVQMPILTAGTDYAIYLCDDRTLRADANFSAPSGFTASTSRKIGGFHYAPGGNATAYNTGGGVTPAINPFSLWDLNWRPACPDPRGMTLVAGQFWADIYLMGVDHHANGTSRNGVTIADGGSSPKVPAMFGGDGTTTYVLTQFAAAEIMASHGKALLDYAEFSAAAFGALEAVGRGNDPVTTGLGTTNAGITNTDQKFTSIWGLMQATGVLWAWGRDKLYRADGIDAAAITAFAYKANTSGRGSVYAQGTVGIVSALLGGAWGYGSACGSRAALWNGAPWDSDSVIGARGRCDHLIHV